MPPTVPTSEVLARHDEIAREVLWQIRDAYDEIVKLGRSPEKDLAKFACQRLVRLGFLAMAGSKNIFAEFNAAIDLVAWKSSYALGVAVVIEQGSALTSDRMQQLDEFSPTMRLNYMPLLKIFVDLDSSTPFTRPSTLGEAYIWGRRGSLSTTPALPGSATQDPNDKDSPF